eukprot:5081777-Alexandrium_andersonii.AAC.1
MAWSSAISMPGGVVLVAQYLRWAGVGRLRDGGASSPVSGLCPRLAIAIRQRSNMFGAVSSEAKRVAAKG